jgi:2-oxoisovalerate dehydrogenase E1 component
MRTVRLMGHAGADVEASYSALEAIEANEAQDPLLHSARILLQHGGLSREEIVARYEEMRAAGRTGRGRSADQTAPVDQ